jgi:hypothetical protein
MNKSMVIVKKNAVKNGSIDEWTLATQNIGTHSHQMAALANAFSEIMMATKRREIICCKCDLPGHMQSECTQLLCINKPQAPATNCPRCGKGKHWAKDCKSKYNKQGNPLNSLWGGPQPRYPREPQLVKLTPKPNPHFQQQ